MDCICGFSLHNEGRKNKTWTDGGCGKVCVLKCVFLLFPHVHINFRLDHCYQMIKRTTGSHASSSRIIIEQDGFIMMTNSSLYNVKKNLICICIIFL